MNENPFYYWLFIFYLTPVLRSFCFWIKDSFFPLNYVNKIAGAIEIYIGLARDILIFSISIFLFSKQTMWQIQNQWFSGWEVQLVSLLLIGLAIYSRLYRWHSLKPLILFAERNAKCHPREFFNHLYARFGFLGHRFPKKALTTINPHHLNFKNNSKSKTSLLYFFKILFAVSLMEILARYALKKLPKHRSHCAASALSIILASAVAQHARAEVIVKPNSEHSARPKGRHIIAFNHKSYLDYIFSQLALYRDDEGVGEKVKNFVPQYLVAKDHFKDNFFLYRIIGIGRMLEDWGMVFVDRKSKNSKINHSKRALRDVSKLMMHNQAPIAIYPHGKRGHGQLAKDGDRLDAAYFCVGNEKRLKNENQHLKKGIAHLALKLVEDGMPLSIWPIAVEGTATIAPNNSLKIKTNVSVNFHQGSPIDITEQDLPEWIMKKIDKCFRQLMDISGKLENRFLTDLREIVDPHTWEETSVSLNFWRGKDDLLYVILDYLYTLKPKYWRGFLNELANLLTHQDSKRDNFLDLRDKIADQLAS